MSEKMDPYVLDYQKEAKYLINNADNIFEENTKRLEISESNKALTYQINMLLSKLTDSRTTNSFNLKITEQLSKINASLREWKPIKPLYEKLKKIINTELNRLEESFLFSADSSVRDFIESSLDVKWTLESLYKSSELEDFFDIFTIEYINFMEKKWTKIDIKSNALNLSIAELEQILLKLIYKVEAEDIGSIEFKLKGWLHSLDFVAFARKAITEDLAKERWKSWRQNQSEHFDGAQDDKLISIKDEIFTNFQGSLEDMEKISMVLNLCGFKVTWDFKKDVLDFQIKSWILKSDSDNWAWNFWPKTSVKLQSIYQNFIINKIHSENSKNMTEVSNIFNKPEIEHLIMDFVDYKLKWIVLNLPDRKKLKLTDKYIARNKEDILHNLKIFFLSLIDMESKWYYKAENPYSSASWYWQWLTDNWKKLEDWSRWTSSLETLLNKTRRLRINKSISDSALKYIDDITPENLITEHISSKWMDYSKEQQIKLLIVDIFTNWKKVENSKWYANPIDNYIWLASIWNTRWMKNAYYEFHHTDPSAKDKQNFDSIFRKYSSRVKLIEN